MAPSKSLTQDQVASAQIQGDYSIKPENAVPKLDTSQWPLLLKNYDKLAVRSSHFTPIPTGCSPLKRDITSYVRCVLPLKFASLCSSYLPVGLVSSTWTSLQTPLRTKLSPG